MIPLTSGQTQRQKVEWWLPEAGCREQWGVCVLMCTVLAGKDERFWR